MTSPLSPQTLSDWRAYHAAEMPGDFGADPDWCAATEAIYPGTLRVLSLPGCPALPFLLKPTAFHVRLGEYTVLRFRPRVLKLMGEAWPGAVSASDMAAALLQAPGWDALHVSAPTESEAWRHWTGMPWRRLGLRAYQPLPPAPHYRIRMPADMDAYLAKFTAKTRKNRLREIRQLAQRGALELRSYRAYDDVAPFLEVAGELSRRSYQHRLLGAGLAEAACLEPRLRLAALRGWLRAYVLYCGGVACSFMLGYQYQGRYHYTAIGYDPEWRDRCAGTVLQMLVLQDMFERDTPEVFDFGVVAPQKEYFGNEREMVGTLVLFRAGLYGALVCAADRAARAVTGSAARLLDRFELKPAAQRLLRRLRGC